MVDGGALNNCAVSHYTNYQAEGQMEAEIQLFSSCQVLVWGCTLISKKKNSDSWASYLVS